MRAELVGDEVELDAPDVGAPVVRQVPGARYDSDRKRWAFPLSWATCVQLRSVLGGDLEIGPELKTWAQNEKQIRVDPATKARDESDGPEPERETEPTTLDVGDDLAPVVVPEEQWWWELWQNMPEYLVRDISPWATIKVHLRNVRDLEEFSRLVGQKLSQRTPAIWFPEAEHLIEHDWRYVNEDDPPPESWEPGHGIKNRKIPSIPRQSQTPGARGEKKKKQSKDAALNALLRIAK